MKGLERAATLRFLQFPSEKWCLRSRRHLLSDVCHLHESSDCIPNIKKNPKNLLQSQKTHFRPHSRVKATDWEQICWKSRLHVADTHLQIKVKALRRVTGGDNLPWLEFHGL